MKITDSVYVAGGGSLGYAISSLYDCNIYVLGSGAERVIIDSGSGMDADRVLAHLKQDGIKPEQVRAIILTHAHADHAGGAAGLRELLSSPVFAGSLTAEIVASGDESRISLPQARQEGIYPSWYRFKACPIDRILAVGERLAVGELTLQVLAAPGHSSDMIALYCPQLGALFAGDAVFAGGKIAVQRSPDFSLKDYRETIAAMAALQVKQLFSGHGTAVPDRAWQQIGLAHQQFEEGKVPESIV